MLINGKFMVTTEYNSYNCCSKSAMVQIVITYNHVHNLMVSKTNKQNKNMQSTIEITSWWGEKMETNIRCVAL